MSPDALRIGDVIGARIGKRRVEWIVRETNGSTAYASAPGAGSVRVHWSHGEGSGHGLSFYFIKRTNDDPAPGEPWTHKNGRRYIVMHVTNRHHDHPDHPPDVVYQSESYRHHVWSRPLSTWHQSFTRTAP